MKGDLKMVAIAPSMLSCDFMRMGEELKSICEAGAEYVHLDVMDGVFVPNLTFGIPVIQAMRGLTDVPFDVHLMIVHPEKYIDKYAQAGADIITVHYEACEDVATVLSQIRKTGKKAGLSIKPATQCEVVYPYLEQLDLVLVMTVEPGFGGQKMIPECLEKVKKIREQIEQNALNIQIEVDGGIHGGTAADAIAAGVDIMVAGSAVFQGKDTESRRKIMDKLRNL